MVERYLEIIQHKSFSLLPIRIKNALRPTGYGVFLKNNNKIHPFLRINNKH